MEEARFWGEGRKKKEREMPFRVKINSTRDISLLFLERALCSQPASCSLLGAVPVFVLLHTVLTLFFAAATGELRWWNNRFVGPTCASQGGGQG